MLRNYMSKYLAIRKCTSGLQWEPILLIKEWLSLKQAAENTANDGEDYCKWSHWFMDGRNVNQSTHYGHKYDVFLRT